MGLKDRPTIHIVKHSGHQPITAPYGSWTSPLTAARVTAGALRLGDIVLDEDDVYWVEGRASEGGRQVVVRRSTDGRTVDVTPPGFSVRTRVHEYGGAACTVDRGTVYFSHFADQRVYEQRAGESPRPISAPGYFFAEAHVDRRRSRLIAVREDHTIGGREPAASIAAILTPDAPGWTDANSSDPGIALVEGFDFLSDPILSPTGDRLAWIGWHHPNMPWDGTELWVAEVVPDGTLGARMKVAGGPGESIFQPEWSPDGVLYFVSDCTGWWNLYRVGSSGVEAVYTMAAEFGKPQWTFAMSTYAFADADRIVATYVEEGCWKLAFIDTRTRRFEPVAIPIQPLESIRATRDAAYFVGGSATEVAAIVRLPFTTLTPERLRPSTAEEIDPEWISVAEPLTFVAPVPRTAAGTMGTPGTSSTPSESSKPSPRRVQAFFYAPCNPDFAPLADTRPPLIVLTHGGPTGATGTVLDPTIQFWTSRGIAVLDVDYSGSTGYGRAYRDRLAGQWGVVDVEDAVAGALAMVERGRADRHRLAIHGASAGGYTTLAALVFHDVFKAGASYYGISDIEVLARDTHKFESRYLDSLIGPYPATRDLYIQRSPIHAASRLSSALILFQGLDDKVVPPNQSEMMAAAARRNGLAVAYLAYEGEQHGFRRRENIVRSLEAELYFYGRVFGFEPADRIEPVPIANL